MEVLTLEQVIMNDQVVTVKITEEGVAIKTAKESVSIKKDQIKNIEIYRSTRKYCMRVIAEAGCYDIINVDDSQVSHIKQRCNTFYGLNITNMELESLNTVEGNLTYNNHILTFHNDKQIFSIPKNKIEKIVEIANGMQFHLDDMEIVLNTTSNATEFLRNKVSEEICVFSNINCVNPRSRSVLIFFEDYLEARGSSYDHSIFYKNVRELLYLQLNDTEHFLVLRLDTPILQGQTKYESMVFLLETKEVEVAAKDSRLKEYYRGGQDEVLVEIMESMLDIKAQSSDFSVKCTNKVNDGHLFFLRTGVQFLPKPISLGINEIILVEFSRLNISVMQTKTFDMTIHTDKLWTFNGIPKDLFGSIEEYFTGHGIKMVSEVIEDEASGGSMNDSDDGSDISSIIAHSDDME